MRYIVPKDCKPTIPLGRVGENEYTEIAFDVSEWQAEYNIDAIALIMQGARDAEPYPATMRIEGNYAIHTITSTDLRNAGNGKCQIQMLSGDVVAKSRVFTTVCLVSLEAGEDVPEPWQSWMTEFVRLAGEAEGSATTATEKANIAIAAKDEAIEAKNSAIEAKNSAIEAAENARGEVAEAFGEITASATTLEAGQSATASFDPSSKVMSFGIPKGQPGDGEDYNALRNKPKLNGIPFEGDKSGAFYRLAKLGYIQTYTGEYPAAVKPLSITDNGVTTDYLLFCVDDEVD